MRTKENTNKSKHQFTPIAKFGKDHWSTLAFIECVCVDSALKGSITDKHRARMRTNIKTHPLMGYWPGGPIPWRAKYDTHLKDGSQIPNHDDWDCAEDLEATGLLENNGTGTNPVYKLTPFGSRICGALRTFKALGGSFATFDYAQYDKVPA